jgi:hypothetical protein
VNDKKLKMRPHILYGTIVRDIHFWIPLLVLIAGMLVLRELR